MMKKPVSNNSKIYREPIDSEILDSKDLAKLSGAFSWGVSNHVSWTPEPEGRKLPLRLSETVINLSVLK